MKPSTRRVSKSLITNLSSQFQNSKQQAQSGFVNLSSPAKAWEIFNKCLWILSDKRRLEKCL